MLHLLLALLLSSTPPCAGSTPGPGTPPSHPASSPYCRRLSALPRSLVLVQSSDGAVMVRSLLRPDGQVVRCSLVRDQTAIRSFDESCLRQGLGLVAARAGGARQRWAADRAACLGFLNRRPEATLEPSAEDALWSPAADRQPRTGHPPAPRRTKRGFTYPGTLWCGAGNNADTYDHLGEFSETDKCCREHDHCAHVIYPFSSSYGHRNLRLHTLSHCDCDSELKKCLRRVNDTSSRIVGQAFFNVLEVPCFDLTYKEQCVERFWYGWCKRYDHVLVAVPRESVLFDYGGDLIDETDTEMKPALSSPSALPWTGGAPTFTATPDPPSQPSTLGQVFHAAEDLLKVMATVTQSSAHGHLPGTASGSAGGKDHVKPGKGEEKKRKKNSRRKGKKRRKGKGRKRKGKGKAGSETTNILQGLDKKIHNKKDYFAEKPGNRKSNEVAHRYFENSLDLKTKGDGFNVVMGDGYLQRAQALSEVQAEPQHYPREDLLPIQVTHHDGGEPPAKLWHQRTDGHQGALTLAPTQPSPNSRSVNRRPSALTPTAEAGQHKETSLSPSLLLATRNEVGASSRPRTTRLLVAPLGGSKGKKRRRKRKGRRRPSPTSRQSRKSAPPSPASDIAQGELDL